MSKTDEEKGLLAKMARGLLDGPVGDILESGFHKRVYSGKYIKNGVPVSFIEGESTRFFTGRENERIPGKREEKRYDTDELKLEFLQKYGWLTDDKDARDYSSKFKPKK